MAAPVAIRELVEDPVTGALRVMFRDAISGVELPLSSVAAYTITSPNGLGSLSPVNAALNPNSSGEIPVVPTTDQANFTPITPPKPEELVNSRGSGTENVSYGDGKPRNASSNYGFIDKPGLMGLTNMVPGPIGLASRMASGVINANNASAVSAARQGLGLEGTTPAGIAKTAITGSNGQIGDVNIDDNTYSVGFGATTPDGRSNLTANEARQRALTSRTGLTEATPEQSELNTNESQVQKPTGLLGGMINKGKGLLGIPTSSPLNTAKPATVANTSTPANRVSSASSPLASSPLQTKTASSPVPSFSEASAMTSSRVPSASRPNVGTVSSTDLEDRDPGLAGVVNPRSISVRDGISLNGLTSPISKALGKVSEAVPDATVISGYRSPERNKRANGAKNSQHLQGNAVDIEGRNLTTQQKVDAMEAAGQAGVKGVGIYNKGTSLHLDTRKTGFATWGPSPKGKYSGVDISAQPEAYQDTLTAIRDAGPYNIGPKVGPTPKSRPTPEAVAQPSITPNKKNDFANRNLDNISLSNLTDQQRGVLSQTIAGELDGRTLRGLARNDPKALAEASQITQVAANRIASVGFDRAITPSQFNSISPKSLPTTRDNYKNFGSLVSGIVNKTLDGEVTAPSPRANHYSNRAVATDHSWESSMTEVNKINDHTFGTISSRFGKSAAAKAQETKAKQEQSTYSDFSGVARDEQKADRKVSDTSNAPKSGLGTKSKTDKNTKSSTKSSMGPSSRGSTGSSSKSGGLASKSSGGMGPSSRGSSSKSSKNDSKGSKSSGSSKGGSKSGKK